MLASSDNSTLNAIFLPHPPGDFPCRGSRSLVTFIHGFRELFHYRMLCEHPGQCISLIPKCKVPDIVLDFLQFFFRHCLKH